jgi:hypothetical protein
VEIVSFRPVADDARCSGSHRVAIRQTEYTLGLHFNAMKTSEMGIAALFLADTRRRRFGRKRKKVAIPHQRPGIS